MQTGHKAELVDSIHIKKNGFIDWEKIDWSYDDGRIALATRISLRQVKKNRRRYDKEKIEELELKRQKEQEAKEAAEAQRRKEEKYAALKKYGGKIPKYSRKCHDCGKPTNDYRCPKCLAKWRIKHCVSSSSVEDNMVAIAV